MATAINSRLVALVFLLGIFTLGSGNPRDVDCLRSIKESLDDPFHRLSSWVFDNSREGFICSFVGVECWHDEYKVQTINLGGMGLKGKFPRGLANCTYLTAIDLSTNSLYGTIPSDLSSIVKFATSLDLSFNNLSGEIPADLANCSYLNSIQLSNNQLTGQIPPEIGLLDRLKIFNVSTNLLSGPVPNFISATMPSESYANNLGLCAGPLEPCKSNSETKKQEKILFTSGFVVGWVLSTILALVLNLFIVPILSARKLKSKNAKKQKTTASQGPRLLTSNWRIQDSKIMALEKHVTRMSFEELGKATDDFHCMNIIGKGKLGTMYKAILQNGWFLAVKKLHNSYDFDQEFMSELMTAGRMRHCNFVPLIGFCYEINSRLLVYKYMSNGNLHDLLFSAQNGKVKCIEWPMRVKIAVGIARGLSWLHQVGVVHSSICSRCILLDHSCEPKISNFGSAKLLKSNFTSSSWRTVVDNEVWESGSFKKDVYEFGVVLHELIAEKEFNQMNGCLKSFEGLDMAEWIFQNSKPYDSDEIRQASEDEILEFVRVAVDCIQSDPARRPSMLEVYKTLSKITGRSELAND
ncbi:probably inactive leucine-rich repeat receptor-like protein kinase At5g48380 [Coffea arabica]|uniref:Probably inactive leucine-rich repeat receptor-like protein kinase At5g48380 n=1 Tax=Coffea arabica TaxID=13443 RepID=A0ABM4X9X4_COFAR